MSNNSVVGNRVNKIILYSLSPIKLQAVKLAFPTVAVQVVESGPTTFAQPFGPPSAFLCIDQRFDVDGEIGGERLIKECKDDGTMFLAVENYISWTSVDGETGRDSPTLEPADFVAVKAIRRGGLWMSKHVGEPRVIPEKYRHLMPELGAGIASGVIGTQVTFGEIMHQTHGCNAKDWFSFAFPNEGPRYGSRVEQIAAVLQNVVNDLRDNDALEQTMQKYVDYPKPGIVFHDVMPVFLHHERMCKQLKEQLINALHSHIFPHCIYFVAGIESRGLIMGGLFAASMGLPFVAIRKQNKLPFDATRPVLSASYKKEYGEDVIEVQPSHLALVAPGSRCILMDDIVATGGSMMAAASLIKQCGFRIAALAVLDDVTPLRAEWRKRVDAELPGVPVVSLF